jgi:hypothetical protein
LSNTHAIDAKLNRAAVTSIAEVVMQAPEIGSKVQPLKHSKLERDMGEHSKVYGDPSTCEIAH